jgi:hypothetical protein
MKPGRTTLPVQSMASALGNLFFISVAPPTPAIFYPSTTTAPFQVTWFF